MSKHQIIYTSCMRGIDGINDGQQIYSYDADFQDSKSQDVRSLFTYQTPALEAGVVMSEELALTMPKAFIFRKLDNGTCAVTLNTYLGRDYMGSTGRFGNYLSHSIICDEAEYTCYPCEFYGSEMLRDSMAFEEVNNSEKPNFLPIPELLRGYRVDIDNIIEFLDKDDHIDIFNNMLHAMLSFESERKRLVICDEPDNIIMWIAALEYTLPLKIALNINFTTYEYDPSLSRSQICGVVRNGTKYSPEIDESSQLYFIFDLYRKDTVDFNKKEDFYDFIRVSMLYDYNTLKKFHEFLIGSYSYSNANLEYYNAYSLYKLRSDGLLEINRESFVNAVSFAGKFASSIEKIDLIKQLLSEKDVILKFEDNYSLEVFTYILGSYRYLSESTQKQIKCMVTETIITSLRETERSEEKFISFSNKIDKLCREAGFSIAAELMNEDNRQKIFDVIQQGISNWKLDFIVKILSLAENFANNEEKIALTEQLLSKKDIIFQFDDIYSLEVFHYILGSYGFLPAFMQEQIKGFVLEKTLNSFRETGKSKEEFIHFYKNMDKLCNTAGFSIVAELVNEYNQQKIFAAVQYDASNWKLDFIIKVLCKYVEDKSIPIEELCVEYPIGKLYGGIVQSLYETNENNGYFVVTKIFDEFSNNHNYLTNMALNIENVLLNLHSGKATSLSMWKRFYEVIAKSQYENRNSVFTILNNCNRTEQIYGLFESLLNSNQDSIDKDVLFKEHYNFFVTNNRKYSKEYLPRILGAYYEYVKRNRDRNRDINLIEIELFDIIYQNKLDVSFVNELIDNIMKKIPLERPSKENAKIITDIFDYNFKYHRQDISEKALLIFVGMNTEKIKSNKGLQSSIAEIERITNGKKVNLLDFSESSAEKYLKWIVPYVTTCQTSAELIRVYKLFNMSSSISKMYITMCAKDYLKQSLNYKEYGSFCEFLKFLFAVGNVNEREATGKVLCKLSKQKLELMDVEIKAFFRNDKNLLNYWSDIKEIALSTNPLLNGISSFFKRIKK